MGIGWLWIYTHSNNPEPLATENEKRAFSIYTRWRAFILRINNIYTGICAYHRQRLARRTLLALPDHLLRDIGKFRTGSDVRTEEVHQPRVSRNVTRQERQPETKTDLEDCANCQRYNY